MQTVGDRLRWARRRRAWTQGDLANASGVSVPALTRIETGRTQPRPTTLVKLAHALQVNVAWLSVGEEPMVRSHPQAGQEHEGKA